MKVKMDENVFAVLVHMNSSKSHAELPTLSYYQITFPVLMILSLLVMSDHHYHIATIMSPTK